MVSWLKSNIPYVYVCITGDRETDIAVLVCSIARSQCQNYKNQLLRQEYFFINPQPACARERVTVVTLSVSLCVIFYFGEGYVFRVETYISTF